jgi:hypothetical protein
MRKGSCVSIYNHFDALKVKFESVPSRKTSDANVIKDGKKFFIREGDWQAELLRSDSHYMYWESNKTVVVFTRAVKKDGRCELPEKNSIEKLTESTMSPLSVKEQFMLYGDYFAYQRYLQSHHVKYEIAATRLGKALKSWLIKTLKKCGENQIPFELVKPKNRRDRFRRGYCWYYCQIGHCAKGNNCDFIHPIAGPSTTDNSFASTKDTSRLSSPEYLGDLDELPNVQVTTPR